jgi:drug/metabolite transporter (DMT)-like permease
VQSEMYRPASLAGLQTETHRSTVVLIAVGAALVLAALDLLGTVLAKQWAQQGKWPLLGAGLVTFCLLWIIYARSLRYAELTPVTLGWIVVLQTGVVLLDRFHYGVRLSPSKLVAVALALALVGYVLLAPDQAANTKPSGLPSSAASTEVSAAVVAEATK